MTVADRVQARIDGLRDTLNVDQVTRRAIANKLNSAWAVNMANEQFDRRERAETIMGEWDFTATWSHVLTPAQRAEIQRVIDSVPNNIRADLDIQQYRLHTEVYRRLGAEHRRRVAEARCWIIDAIEHVDALEFFEARRLIVDAEHALGALLSFTTEQERPSRRRAEADPHLREQMQRVATALRRDAVALREVASA